MLVNTIFIVVTILIVAGLVLWIAIVIRRAGSIDRASSNRLSTDLSRLASDPEVVSTSPTPPVPVMFSDDLTTEVTAIADAAIEEERVEVAAAPTPAAATPAPEPASDISAPAAPATSELEAKLAKLDDLHARGVITDAEHSAARLNALND